MAINTRCAWPTLRWKGKRRNAHRCCSLRRITRIIRILLEIERSIREDQRKSAAGFNELSSSGMEFALAGELRVGPLVFLGRRGCSGGRGGRRDRNRLNTPIRGRGMDAPDISRLFQCESHQPEFSASSQWHAVHDERCDRLPGRKFVEIHLQPGLQRTRKTDAAALRVDDQSLATFGELGRRIKTGDSQRKLGTNAGASARGLVRCSGGLHALLQNSTSASEEFRLRTARKEHQGNHRTLKRG